MWCSANESTENRACVESFGYVATTGGPQSAKVVSLVGPLKYLTTAGQYDYVLISIGTVYKIANGETLGHTTRLCTLVLSPQSPSMQSIAYPFSIVPFTLLSRSPSNVSTPKNAPVTHRVVLLFTESRRCICRPLQAVYPSSFLRFYWNLSLNSWGNSFIGRNLNLIPFIFLIDWTPFFLYFFIYL